MASITAWVGFETEEQGAGYPQTISYTLAQLGRISAWQITDAWGEVDDTIHLTFNEDVLRAEDLENADVVVAVVDGRLFGPYDVKEFAATPAFNEYKISGQQDRRFEHTALDASETLASQAESLFEGEPYSKWGNADVRRTIGTIVKVAVQHSRSLAGMRSALSDYGLSIFPHAVLSISGDVMTRVRAASLAPVVPTSVSTRLSQMQATVVEADDGSSSITEIRRVPVSRVVPATDKRKLRDTGYRVPDVWNGPGDYVDRHIVCGYRAPGSGLVAVEPPPDETDATLRHRQVELEIVSAGVGGARWAINARRWELQHTAAIAMATWPEGLIELAPNRLMLGVSRKATDLWRAVNVTHKGQGLHYTTSGEFALYQTD